jgi:hypothetical protein
MSGVHQRASTEYVRPIPLWSMGVAEQLNASWFGHIHQ